MTMAATAKKTNSRMDFSGSINEVYEKNAANQAEPEPIAAETAMIEESRVVQSSAVSELEQVKTSSGDIQNRSNKAKTPAKQEKRTAKQIPSDMRSDLAKLLSAKSKRGISRTVYFEADVFEYIDAISQESGVSFSPIINLLLKQAIELNRQ